MQQPTRTIQSRYNYGEAWTWLEHKGQEIYGAKFKLYEEDKHIVYLLLCWFLQDDIAAPELELNLEKGILLSGPVGCGKTSLMNLMKYMTTEKNRFATKACREISFEFMEDGFSVIHKYSRGSLTHYQPRIYCFDDLGVESSLKHYGNECNVMAEILLTRYDLYIANGLITHATTNLSAGEIEQAYGNRVRSRMREMFNLIAFNNNSIDKRQ